MADGIVGSWNKYIFPNKETITDEQIACIYNI
jgi:hypothetical protein